MEIRLFLERGRLRLLSQAIANYKFISLTTGQSIKLKKSGDGYRDILGTRSLSICLNRKEVGVLVLSHFIILLPQVDFASYVVDYERERGRRELLRLSERPNIIIITSGSEGAVGTCVRCMITFCSLLS